MRYFLLCLTLLFASHTVKADINVTYKTDRSTINRWVAPKLEINNTSNQAIDLSDLAIEYFFDGGSPFETSESDYILDLWFVSGGNAEAVSLEMFVEGNSAAWFIGLPNANFKVSATFAEGFMLAANDSLKINYGFRRVDGELINSASHYSYMPTTDYVINRNIVIRDTQTDALLWGNPRPEDFNYVARDNLPATIFSEGENLQVSLLNAAGDGNYSTLLTVNGTDERSYSDQYLAKITNVGVPEWYQYLGDYDDCQLLTSPETYTAICANYDPGFEDIDPSSRLLFATFDSNGIALERTTNAIATLPNTSLGGAVFINGEYWVAVNDTLITLNADGNIIASTTLTIDEAYRIFDLAMLDADTLILAIKTAMSYSLVYVDTDGTTEAINTFDFAFEQMALQENGTLLLGNLDKNRLWLAGELNAYLVNESGELLAETSLSEVDTYYIGLDRLVALQGTTAKTYTASLTFPGTDSLTDGSTGFNLTRPDGAHIDTIAPTDNNGFIVTGNVSEQGLLYPWFAKVQNSQIGLEQ